MSLKDYIHQNESKYKYYHYKQTIIGKFKEYPLTNGRTERPEPYTTLVSKRTTENLSENLK